MRNNQKESSEIKDLAENAELMPWPPPLVPIERSERKSFSFLDLVFLGLLADFDYSPLFG